MVLCFSRGLEKLTGASKSKIEISKSSAASSTNDQSPNKKTKRRAPYSAASTAKMLQFSEETKVGGQ